MRVVQQPPDLIQLRQDVPGLPGLGAFMAAADLAGLRVQPLHVFQVGQGADQGHGPGLQKNGQLAPEPVEGAGLDLDDARLVFDIRHKAQVGDFMAGLVRFQIVFHGGVQGLFPQGADALPRRHAACRLFRRLLPAVFVPVLCHGRPFAFALP